MITNNAIKQEAIVLRKKGFTYTVIAQKLSVNKSTLNGWFRKLVLSKSAQKKILDAKRNSLKITRQKGLQSLKKKYLLENEQVKQQIVFDLEKTPEFSNILNECLLTMLYLGDGFKKKSFIGFGNSNTVIALTFVSLLRRIYKVSNDQLRCVLYLRYDQDGEIEKRFWAKTLSIPLSQFRKTQFDKRTKGLKTRADYHGVCAIYCYDAKIEKRLTALQELLMHRIIAGG